MAKSQLLSLASRQLLGAICFLILPFIRQRVNGEIGHRTLSTWMIVRHICARPLGQGGLQQLHDIPAP